MSFNLSTFYPTETGTSGLSDPSSDSTISGGGGAEISGMVAGAVSNIAVGFINAQRRRNALKFNMRMAELQGRKIRLAADVQIRGIRKRANALLSTQEALVGASGLTFSGSPTAVMVQSLKEAELDIIFTNINADLGIGQTQTQADIFRIQADSATSRAVLNTGTTLLNLQTQLSKL